MQLEVIGVGGAGCRIVDAIYSDTWDGSAVEAFAFDTDSKSLRECTAIPADHRYQYADRDGGLYGDLGRGVELGKQYAEELSNKLVRGQPSLADAFLVVVGLGGATGGGAAPALVRELQILYDAPVYVLATLPATDTDSDPSAPLATDESREFDSSESPSPVMANATRTLELLDGLATAVICFDNAAWLRTGESLAEGRTRLNQALATHVATLFTIVGDDGEATAETAIDTNDLERILGAETDVVTLGFAEQHVETDGDDETDVGSRLKARLFSSKSSDEPSVDRTTAIRAVETAIRKAAHGKHTLEREPENADRALLVVGGPPAWLNRQAIADGRRDLESTIGSTQVLGGDAPRPDDDAVFALVVLAGVGPIARLEELVAVGSS
ncbi:cell division protein FtsZ [Natribaculum luteum]|uniref:Tubulin-like protein CetZ n=1 Tax=Natribaculum luteum TaxID=1586232 RepID=A0ABD5P4Y6_9EURY|nr:cell division protein FtsZ [Natribaculum luteum]